MGKKIPSPKKKRRELFAPAHRLVGDPRSVARRGNYLQVLRPAGPLHLLEQQSELFAHNAPPGLQAGQDGDPAQFGSAQSIRLSQSSSMPSLQTSVVGTQPPPG